MGFTRDFEQHHGRLHVCRFYRHLPGIPSGLCQGSAGGRSRWSGTTDGGAGNRRHRIPDFPSFSGRAMESGEAFVAHDDCYADFSHTLLRVARLLAFCCSAHCGGGRPSQFRTISRVIIQIEAPRDLLGRAMSVFNMDQGMRSLGSIVMGAFATIFGASLGIALTAAVSLIITTALFYRLLGKRV